MHSYLQAIGFEQMDNEKLDKILNLVIEKPDLKKVAVDSEGKEFIELSKNFGSRTGITICGNYVNEKEFRIEYYYPFFTGTGITTKEYMEMDKHSDKESYEVVCDEVRLGVNLVFFLTNTADFLNEGEKWKNAENSKLKAQVSALSVGGKILLPIKKNEKQIIRSARKLKNRSEMIAAAREGDEEAIESLTLEDMDTYSMISKRIVDEDILTIVDSYFMPYGIECDKYSILGEILDYQYVDNPYTEGKMCIIAIETMDLKFDICINEKDLCGELEVGRRFKGILWLQGKIMN